jgi:RNA polymerase sigma-70 factor, ECF subfamily
LDDRIWGELLVLRAQSGDREALEALLRSVQTPLFSHIRRMVGNEGAEDTLQDALIEMCVHIRALREPQFFRAWAYRISTRAALAYIRRNRLWQERRAEKVEIEEIAMSEDVNSQLLDREIQGMLSDLSPPVRAVLSLHYLENLTIAEVAAILKISAGTVKSRLAYGLNKVRKLTGKEG